MHNFYTLSSDNKSLINNIACIISLISNSIKTFNDKSVIQNSTII